MLKVCDVDAHALLYVGENLSFVTLFLAKRFHACTKTLVEPIKVNTPIIEPIVA